MISFEEFQKQLSMLYMKSWVNQTPPEIFVQKVKKVSERIDQQALQSEQDHEAVMKRRKVEVLPSSSQGPISDELSTHKLSQYLCVVNSNLAFHNSPLFTQYFVELLRNQLVHLDDFFALGQEILNNQQEILISILDLLTSRKFISLSVTFLGIVFKNVIYNIQQLRDTTDFFARSAIISKILSSKEIISRFCSKKPLLSQIRQANQEQSEMWRNFRTNAHDPLKQLLKTGPLEAVHEALILVEQLLEEFQENLSISSNISSLVSISPAAHPFLANVVHSELYGVAKDLNVLRDQIFTIAQHASRTLESTYLDLWVFALVVYRREKIASDIKERTQLFICAKLPLLIVGLQKKAEQPCKIETVLGALRNLLAPDLQLWEQIVCLCVHLQLIPSDVQLTGFQMSKFSLTEMDFSMQAFQDQLQREQPVQIFAEWCKLAKNPFHSWKAVNGILQLLSPRNNVSDQLVGLLCSEIVKIQPVFQIMAKFQELFFSLYPKLEKFGSSTGFDAHKAFGSVSIILRNILKSDQGDQIQEYLSRLQVSDELVIWVQETRNPGMAPLSHEMSGEVTMRVLEGLTSDNLHALGMFTPWMVNRSMQSILQKVLQEPSIDHRFLLLKRLSQLPYSLPSIISFLLTDWQPDSPLSMMYEEIQLANPALVQLVSSQYQAPPHKPAFTLLTGYLLQQQLFQAKQCFFEFAQFIGMKAALVKLFNYLFSLPAHRSVRDFVQSPLAQLTHSVAFLLADLDQDDLTYIASQMVPKLFREVTFFSQGETLASLLFATASWKTLTTLSQRWESSPNDTNNKNSASAPVADSSSLLFLQVALTDAAKITEGSLAYHSYTVPLFQLCRKAPLFKDIVEDLLCTISWTDISASSKSLSKDY